MKISISSTLERKLQLVFFGWSAVLGALHLVPLPSYGELIGVLALAWIPVCIVAFFWFLRLRKYLEALSTPLLGSYYYYALCCVQPHFARTLDGSEMANLSKVAFVFFTVYITIHMYFFFRIKNTQRKI